MRESPKRILVSQKAKSVLPGCTYGYLLSVVILTFALWNGGDTSRTGTLLLFSPRWPLGIPLLALVVISLLVARRLLWINLITAGIVVLPWMGYCCGVESWSREPEMAMRIRVLTCNVQGNASDERIQQVVAGFSPDVVMLQECPSPLAKKIFDEAWHLHREDQLCIASRFAIVKCSSISRETYGGWGTVALRVMIAVGDREVQCVNVHLSTPRPGLEAIRDKGIHGLTDLDASTAQRRLESHGVAASAESERPSVIAGDFNTPVESAIYQRDWGRYSNAFSCAGWGLGHTKFTRWHGVRIDHVLATSAWTVRRCVVGPDVGSDHRPVIADLEMRR
jgi:vancomycin resistance protein VanJ